MTWYAWFLLGLTVGQVVFLFVLALCSVAADADRRLRERSS